MSVKKEWWFKELLKYREDLGRERNIQIQEEQVAHYFVKMMLKEHKRLRRQIRLEVCETIFDILCNEKEPSKKPIRLNSLCLLLSIPISEVLYFMRQMADYQIIDLFKKKEPKSNLNTTKGVYYIRVTNFRFFSKILYKATLTQ